MPHPEQQRSDPAPSRRRLVRGIAAHSHRPFPPFRHALTSRQAR
ncbi:hypothetical protein SBD_4464 [Streptomyces bottropensis ATCC 25435]|uniref:Uncharacterized protein n=1 Tax=Streptomyces bottropensis ATCC 25435 TaxID=1054862 RepID=M3DE05_9ACTN|nr:hypothetical protein SBD_4464 [Streptomyces bottropensis ATCC 25435]